MIVLTTKRLILRHLKEEDEKFLFPILSNRAVMRYYDHPESLEETRKRIANLGLKSYQTHGHGFYGCIDRETKTFIGICGLIPWKNINGGSEIEVGYIFDSKFWNRGLATEAAFACFDHGFNHFGYDQLVSIIDPNNAPSIRVAKKNGLVFEAETWRLNKTMLIYSITKKAWEERHHHALSKMS